MVALILGHLVDALRVVADGVNTLPASDRVCPNDWMNGLQIRSNVFWRAALSTVQLEVVFLCALIEDWLCVSSSQPLKEFLVSRRQTVVNLVARGPQGVSASLGKLSQTQDRIVAGDRLKGNVAVPALFVALLLVAAKALSIQLLSLFGADHGDLIIFAAQGTSTVGYGVNVQLGGSRLARELAQTLSKFLLKIVVKTILLAEEDHATLGD